uniref:hydroxyacylglutathione hydrolase n=1 Tax=Trieres chinensis TaxID=1514140 RepID=A0A7S1ZII0_TRICV|mmetsp:Transcript_2621/g.5631  ORF Transcript_2621/g.5631 Transcript_2621/m.5631 type:complete len:348 (+) Transcript_2621:94-1137(+)
MSASAIRRGLAPRKVTTCAFAALLRISTPSLAFVPPHSVAAFSAAALPGISSASSSPSSLTTRPPSSRICDVRREMSSASASASGGGSVTVAQIPCLDDNYGYLIHDEATGATAAVDTPDAEAYRAELQKRGWTLTHVLNTHHHLDHTGGNVELKTDGKGETRVIGPESERDRIPGIDVGVGQGDSVAVGSAEATVIDVGGHTSGHIAYYFPKEKKVFVGDALFALGCGRMFEGTPEQFWDSLKRLRELPDDTTVYCAHEYTMSNAKFAVSVEPGNAELMSRFEDIKAKRANGEPTVPSNLGEEKRTNPFLRGDLSAEIRKNVGAGDGDAGHDVFAKVRKAKDTFRG